MMSARMQSFENLGRGPGRPDSHINDRPSMQHMAAINMTWWHSLVTPCILTSSVDCELKYALERQHRGTQSGEFRLLELAKFDIPEKTRYGAAIHNAISVYSTNQYIKRLYCDNEPRLKLFAMRTEDKLFTNQRVG